MEDAGKPAGDAALSPWELEHKKIVAAERLEANSRSENRGSTGSGIGGYHAVQIPLDQVSERLEVCELNGWECCALSAVA